MRWLTIKVLYFGLALTIGLAVLFHFIISELEKPP